VVFPAGCDKELPASIDGRTGQLEVSASERWGAIPLSGGTEGLGGLSRCHSS
jgi:hypothetical protein